jgi:hypothetical protein
VRLTIAMCSLTILDIEANTDDVKAYGDVVSTATAEAGNVASRDGYEDRRGFR